MTQDSEEDLQYLAMPSGVSVYTPHLPDLDDVNEARPAIAFLEALRDTMANWREGQSVIVRPDGLDPANRRIVDDALGEGEVSIVLEDAAGRIEVQETVFCRAMVHAGLLPHCRRGGRTAWAGGGCRIPARCARPGFSARARGARPCHGCWRRRL
jgi:hypothetical protein